MVAQTIIADHLGHRTHDLSECDQEHDHTEDYRGSGGKNERGFSGLSVEKSLTEEYSAHKSDDCCKDSGNA